MFRHLAILSLAASTHLPDEGLAWQKLSQAELRAEVRNGNSLSLSKVLRKLRQTVPGEAVDVRAVLGDRIFYRFIVQRANGRLTPVVVDAATGKVIPNSSAAAREVGDSVRDAARRPGDAQNPSSGKSSRGKSGGVTGNGNSCGAKNRTGGGNSNGGGNSGNSGSNGRNGGNGRN